MMSASSIPKLVLEKLDAGLPGLTPAWGKFLSQAVGVCLDNRSHTHGVISYVYYDGQEYRSEGDEYAVVKNVGSAAVNLQGWRLNAGDAYQNFTFPSFVLGPGA